jgi:hypothetical protein
MFQHCFGGDFSCCAPSLAFFFLTMLLFWHVSSLHFGRFSALFYFMPTLNIHHLTKSPESSLVFLDWPVTPSVRYSLVLLYCVLILLVFSLNHFNHAFSSLLLLLFSPWFSTVVTYKSPPVLPLTAGDSY